MILKTPVDAAKIAKNMEEDSHSEDGYKSDTQYSYKKQQKN